MKKTEIREAVTIENKGEKIFAVFHQPLNRTNVPAVLICPGFAGNKCGKHRLFVRLAQQLASEGFAVLRFDYRGAGDSEGEFESITLEDKISDTLACLDFLAAQPLIDSSRLALLGRSLGGAIAILSASRSPLVKSLALWAPVFSSDPWRPLWEAHQANKLDLVNKEMIQRLPAGIPNLLFLQQFFTIDLKKELEKLKHLPLLHLHGELDQVVKIDQAEGYKAVRGLSLKTPTKFVILPNSDHDFSDPVDQQTALHETIEWFKHTL